MTFEQLGNVLARSVVAACCLAALSMFVLAQDASVGGEPAEAPLTAPGPEASSAAEAETYVRTPVGELHGPVPLYRVLDGDTLAVMSNVGPRTVRLIGIDAPEHGQPGSRDAEAALVQLLEPGVLLWLELDLGLEDIYGRLLAYVYVPDATGRWEHAGMRLSQVNLAMLHAGWARPLKIEPNITYADLYQLAADRAQASGLGMWAAARQGSAGVGGDVEGDESGGLEGDAHSARSTEGASSSAGVTEVHGGPPIRIHCGLLNPVADNDVGEWVSVYLTEPHDTRGYYLFDAGSRSIFRLPTGVQPAGEIRVHNPGQGVWNNSGDTVYLMRGGEVVDSWEYQAHEARSGVVVCRAQ